MSDQPAEPSDRADTNPASLAPCAWTQNKGWGLISSLLRRTLVVMTRIASWPMEAKRHSH